MPIFQGNESKKAPKFTRHEAADGVRIAPGPFIGIVKNNTDPLRAGRLQVWISELGGDADNPESWRTVSYTTPFYGVTPVPELRTDNFQTAPHSYGMWFSSPDVGSQVLCIFINGDPFKGFWFSVIPEWPNLHMLPGISKNVAGNSGPDPVVNFNDQSENGKAELQDFANKARPKHDIQSQIWTKQGLLNDPDRGPGTSSALRETPSRVFGISTPGPELNPGDNDPTYPGSVKGRQGGHTFVRDDGDIQGNNQMMRFRTSKGNMILMNDTKGFIYVTNAAGTAWVELDAMGGVSVFSQTQMKMYAKGGMMLDTDGKMQIHGKGGVDIKSDGPLNLDGKDVNISGSGSTKVTGKTGLHLKGKNTYLTGDSCVQILGGTHIDVFAACYTVNTKKATAAQAAGSATAPQGMPTHEPWSGHAAGNSGKNLGTTYGAQFGLNAGVAGPYGAAGGFGSNTNQQMYGNLPNNLGPTKYAPGFQGGTAGQGVTQGSGPAQNSYDAGSKQYQSVPSGDIGVKFGGGMSFDVATNGISRLASDGTRLALGEAQNNPGNIRFSANDPLAIGQNNGFAVYRSPEDGIAAMTKLVGTYQDKYNLNTPYQIINRYAPVGDNNDPTAYARTIQNLTGLDPNKPIDTKDPATMARLTSAMIQVEQGKVRYSYDQVLSGVSKQLGANPSDVKQQIQPGNQPYLNATGASGTSGTPTPDGSAPPGKGYIPVTVTETNSDGKAVTKTTYVKDPNYVDPSANKVDNTFGSYGPQLPKQDQVEGPPLPANSAQITLNSTEARLSDVKSQIASQDAQINKLNDKISEEQAIIATNKAEIDKVQNNPNLSDTTKNILVNDYNSKIAASETNINNYNTKVQQVSENQTVLQNQSATLANERIDAQAATYTDARDLVGAKYNNTDTQSMNRAPDTNYSPDGPTGALPRGNVPPPSEFIATNEIQPRIVGTPANVPLPPTRPSDTPVSDGIAQRAANAGANDSKQGIEQTELAPLPTNNQSTWNQQTASYYDYKQIGDNQWAKINALQDQRSAAIAKGDFKSLDKIDSQIAEASAIKDNAYNQAALSKESADITAVTNVPLTGTIEGNPGVPYEPKYEPNVVTTKMVPDTEASMGTGFEGSIGINAPMKEVQTVSAPYIPPVTGNEDRGGVGDTSSVADRSSAMASQGPKVSFDDQGNTMVVPPSGSPPEVYSSNYSAPLATPAGSGFRSEAASPPTAPLDMGFASKSEATAYAAQHPGTNVGYNNMDTGESGSVTSNGPAPITNSGTNSSPSGAAPPGTGGTAGAGPAGATTGGAAATAPGAGSC